MIGARAKEKDFKVGRGLSTAGHLHGACPLSGATIPLLLHQAHVTVCIAWTEATCHSCPHVGGARLCSCFLYNLETCRQTPLCATNASLFACATHNHTRSKRLRIGESCQGTKTPVHRQTRLPTPFILKAAGTQADHLSAFHRPDLYAESVDCRVGLG